MMLHSRSNSNARPTSSSATGAAGGTSSDGPPLSRGLGAGAALGAGPTSQGALASRGPLLEEELKAEANQLLSMNRGGVQGTPAKLQARPWRKGNGAADSKRHGGERTPSASPAPG